ncbi:MAG: hypothetical protein HFH87_06185 [Lachnospiraceae bacterium]|nr:hypothetical protein [Lachnospiraceae bacterium]
MKEYNIELLFAIIRLKGYINIRVSGYSMNPTLYEGDSITVQRADIYAPGDILVFRYRSTELLVHRLLFVKENNEKFPCFICKGDNAFRLEDIGTKDIVGKVIMINGSQIVPWPSDLIRLSYEMSKQVVRDGYDLIKIKKSPQYEQYIGRIKNIYKEREEIRM